MPVALSLTPEVPKGDRPRRGRGVRPQSVRGTVKLDLGVLILTVHHISETTIKRVMTPVK